MILSIRDKIQDLQLSVFQDYLEIQMDASYGDAWIDEIIRFCENKVETSRASSIKPPNFHSYKKIVKEKREKGAIRIDKKSFDITLLYSLLHFDFLNVCKAENNDTDVFQNYITVIKNNKNELASHISDLQDVIYVNKLQTDSLYNLKEFIVYLERLGWRSKSDAKKDFIERYKEKINALSIEMSGVGTESEVPTKTSKGQTDESANEMPSFTAEKVHIFVSVQDQKGNIVSGYKLEMRNINNETVASWTTSNEEFCFFIESGKYRIVEIKVPQGYKKGNDYFFEVESENENKHYVKSVERAVSNDELYIKAFGYLANPAKYEEAVSLLTNLEKNNYIEAVLLLAFLFEQGIGVPKDSEKSKELLDFASFQQDESLWYKNAEKLIEEEKYSKAVPYYLAYSQKKEEGDGFYQAGRIFIKRIINYEFCKLCFRLAFDNGKLEAKSPYEYVSKKGKDGYMNLKR